MPLEIEPIEQFLDGARRDPAAAVSTDHGALDERFHAVTKKNGAPNASAISAHTHASNAQ
jgi:hypothetical protein